MKNNTKTIYDISEKAGVSTATVSRVMNGSDKVKESTREKVLKVIEEYGYEPNAFARGLGTGSMKTIGIMCADVADIYLANAVSFLERGLREKGFNTILSCSGYEYKQKVRSLRSLENNGVDAIILVGSQYIEKNSKQNEYIKDASKRIPVMLLNAYLKGDNIYCNMSDDREAYYEATQILIDSGCSAIMFLYREVTYSASKKYKGYAEALEENLIEKDDQLKVMCNSKIDGVKEALAEKYDELCKTGKRIDAILAADDELAVGAIKFLAEKGIKIPEEVSVIGCNDSVLAITCCPELSSIDNKCEVLCVNTVNTLMRILNHQDASNKTMVMSEYIKRNTTRL